MRKGILILVLSISFKFLFSQNIDEQNIRRHINYIASDKLKGRSPGEIGEKLAAKYIVTELNKIAVQPKGDKGYLQSFKYLERTNPHDTIGNKKLKRSGKNIIGFIDNGAAYTIVIGAHYDHLGMGNHGSSLDANPKKKIHNGADDNASGVAGVLELARHYATNKINERYNFLFIFFSAEESGLIGSKYFTNNPTIDLSSVNAMINMDMIGRFNDSTNTIMVHGTGTSPVFESIVNSAARSFQVKTDSSGIGPSDHTTFYLKDIPVLFFFTGAHSDYHKPTDDVEKINFVGEVKVLDYIVNIIDALSQIPKLEFSKTRQPDQAKVSFKVTLGVMPDYSYSGKGLRLDGVTDGKPASVAGFKTGDIVIKIGNFEINDIQEYMKALSNFSKGQTTDVEVMRGKEVIKKSVTF